MWQRFGHNGQEADEGDLPVVQEMCWLLRMVLKSSQPLTLLLSGSMGEPGGAARVVLTSQF